MDDNDFDRRQERQEELDDERFSARLRIEELSRLRMQRCCVFLKDFDDFEILHGRLVGVLAEMDAVVVRDLRPGREALQSKQIVPRENIYYLCSSAGTDKCQACSEYRDLLREAELEARRRPFRAAKRPPAPKVRARMGGKKEKAGESSARTPS